MRSDRAVVEANHRHVDCIRRLCRHIEKNLEEPLTLSALGAAAGLSPAHVQRVFKKVTGITPRQYADACRLGRLKARLRKQGTVTMAMYEAGYGSSSRLYERADLHLGMTPATYQRGGDRMLLRYTIVDSPLGRLLMAGTDRGIAAVSLGDKDAPLETFLRGEYPAAKLVRDETALAEWVTAVVGHLEGKAPHVELPLDVQATAFQWRVWQELCKIPYGTTRTYRAIAESIGRPSAVRAVARACATNPVSIVVPCHRVVREDGELAGYRWGIERKRKLLTKERDRRQSGPKG
jgi:AraC family transcriptional regulator, regulatory protein of adaptative response / methylated-DNA-[protein]-cysteine methyltransferase